MPAAFYEWVLALVGSLLGLHLASGIAGFGSGITDFQPASCMSCSFKDQSGAFFCAERSNLAAVSYEQSLTIWSNNQFIKETIYKGTAITANF